MATIFITHDLALAAEYCDRIVVMHAGHIVEAAPGRELFAIRAIPIRPSCWPRRRARPSSLAELASIPGGLPDLRRTDLPACRYSGRCERRLDRLRRAAAAARPWASATSSPAGIRYDRTALLDVAELAKRFAVGARAAGGTRSQAVAPLPHSMPSTR